MEKIIKLTQLADIGNGSARITENSVDIEVNGISGGMKVWLVGGCEAEKVGNIVNGRLSKKIDTTNHTGILITQSGRQMMFGRYEETSNEMPMETMPEDNFMTIGGVKLKKITQRSYDSFSDEMRYLLSNRSVYENYKKHGYYCLSEDSRYGTLALKCEENEENPLAYFGDMCSIKDGYVIVCIDKETKKFKKV